MKKILVVFGTRPEAIKMAPLVKVLKANPEVECFVCITAQHRQMLDQVLEAFQIMPDFDLDIMQKGQTLSDITNRVLDGVGSVIREVKPDVVLVHGDTTTAFAAALAAFYQQVAIGHVEAGLRTWDKYSPYPEEMNRQMVDSMADFYFAPTMQSKQNLLDENRRADQIFVTGNTAIDALKTTVEKEYTHPVLDWCKESRMLLLTAHRRENTGEPMRNIFHAINRITQEYHDVKVIYPVHMNPAVQNIANEILGENHQVRLIEPLDVLDFHNFMNESHLILTDSGGIQEEAPSLGKPVLVLRDTTERPEGVAGGTLKLVGTDEASVYYSIKELLEDSQLYKEMSQANNPYGDGRASERIVNVIMNRDLVTGM
ncbi:UDP-N-acetylglucosamine 2-epimerase (non-hydrolyzing) [Lachnospiraceae bacterium OttesenSCG-928-E19]|nr:UDP-N-acetylglucosamine 2-epimerase (non-hydrolyzing) [Lachnospiraceae bacterium OttesenSCG-928-E19]